MPTRLSESRTFTFYGPAKAIRKRPLLDVNDCSRLVVAAQIAAELGNKAALAACMRRVDGLKDRPGYQETKVRLEFIQKYPCEEIPSFWTRLISSLMSGQEMESFLFGKRVLDLACGSKLSTHLVTPFIQSDNPPNLCRWLKCLGAKPVGLDRWSNDGEEFEHMEWDLRKSCPEFPPASFDVVIVQGFLSAEKRESPSDDCKDAQITVGRENITVGHDTSTAPELSKWLRHCEEGLGPAAARIGMNIVNTARHVLVDGGGFFFDRLQFLKRNEDFELKHDGNFDGNF